MLDVLSKTLKNNGYSLTKARLTVFGALQAPKPKTMNQLVRELGDVVDRASIYRSVALFETLGVVTRIQHGWKYRLELSDDYTPHHHHLTCNLCHRIISFDEPNGFAEIVTLVASTHGFQLESHGLEVFGICPSCQVSNN